MLNGISPKKVFLYQLLTLGLYYFYWCSKSRQAINKAAGRSMVPTTWLLVVPAWNYWWAWQYSNALEFVTYSRIKKSDTFAVYVIGSCFLFGTYSFFPDFSSDTSSSPNLHAILIIAGIVIGLLILASIVGFGFFCAITQKKINAITTQLSTKSS